MAQRAVTIIAGPTAIVGVVPSFVIIFFLHLAGGIRNVPNKKSDILNKSQKLSFAFVR